MARTVNASSSAGEDNGDEKGATQWRISVHLLGSKFKPIDRKVKPQLRLRRGEYGPRLLAPVGRRIYLTTWPNVFALDLS